MIRTDDDDNDIVVHTDKVCVHPFGSIDDDNGDESDYDDSDGKDDGDDDDVKMIMRVWGWWQDWPESDPWLETGPGPTVAKTLIAERPIGDTFYR